MKKFLVIVCAVVLGLMAGAVSAQGLAFEGHTSGTAQTVKDANGVSTALQVSTAGVNVAGTLSATGAITLPEGGVEIADLGAVGMGEVILCGDLASTGTLYMGPATDSWEYGGDDYSIAGTACTALDNATEATADAPIMANVAFKVMGMYCKVSGSGSNGVALALRSAAAATTPAIGCTIPTGETDCYVAVSSTTDIAAGATIAVSSITTEDLSAQDAWCKVFVAPIG